MTATPPAAIITGSAHGIGRGIARHLLNKGWKVFALDQDSVGLDALAREQTDASDRLHVMTADTGSEADIEHALQHIGSLVDRLDGLVCNAGIMIRKPLGMLSLAEWNRVLGVNLTGPFLLARAAAPLLSQLSLGQFSLGQPGEGALARGAIVTIGSTRAHMSEPDTESYSASKGGLLALTHALAVSLGPAIRVNCISPGWIDVAGDALRDEDHAQHPAGRVGTVEDVASLAAWLLGPDSGFVTGAEFIVDGGMTRRMLYAE